MSGTASRQSGTSVTMLTGVVAVGLWASHALRAAFGESDLSDRALFVYFSFVLIGVALATLLSVLTGSALPRWRKRHANTMTVADHLLVGLVMLGLGAGPLLYASPDAWDWAMLVLGSLAGGLNLGAAFVVASNLRQTAPGPAPGIQPPARYDWR